jgi:hypothetical protein
MRTTRNPYSALPIRRKLLQHNHLGQMRWYAPMRDYAHIRRTPPGTCHAPRLVPRLCLGMHLPEAPPRLPTNPKRQREPVRPTGSAGLDRKAPPDRPLRSLFPPGGWDLPSAPSIVH